ncbi:MULTISPECIES: hypothetical protein [unclassified Novosphingobium]|uniref:hypothetical protein n=1 Tax=unclassified Novosphingobium TaxID=2644732 RepID=UPI001358B45D|nr:MULTISPECIES: hypothetical protein [unclassified Novosphingobium]
MDSTGGGNAVNVSLRGSTAVETEQSWAALSAATTNLDPIRQSAWSLFCAMLTDCFGVTWVCRR